MGGEEIIGREISELYEENDKKLQFTSKVLLVYDPTNREFYLAAIGNEILKNAEHLKSSSELTVFPSFKPVSDQLGIYITGRPLTGVIADSDNQRIGQYFENLGIYKDISDPKNVVHLLDYGAWKCSQACDYHSPKESRVNSIWVDEYGIESISM